VPLHIECEGTRPGMHAVGVNGDSVSRSALRRTLDKPQHHLVGDFEPINAVVVRRAAVLGELIDARLAAIDSVRAGHYLVADGLRGAGRDEEVQELRSHGRREFPCHRGEEIVPQKLPDVACEVLLEVKHLEGGEGYASSVGNGPQLEILD